MPKLPVIVNGSGGFASAGAGAARLPVRSRCDQAYRGQSWRCKWQNAVSCSMSPLVVNVCPRHASHGAVPAARNVCSFNGLQRFVDFEPDVTASSGAPFPCALQGEHVDGAPLAGWAGPFAAVGVLAIARRRSVRGASRPARHRNGETHAEFKNARRARCADRQGVRGLAGEGHRKEHQGDAAKRARRVSIS